MNKNTRAARKQGFVHANTSEKVVKGVSVDSTVSSLGKHRTKKNYPGKGPSLYEQSVQLGRERESLTDFRNRQNNHR